jgi:hypothetical protein
VGYDLDLAALFVTIRPCAVVQASFNTDPTSGGQVLSAHLCLSLPCDDSEEVCLLTTGS